MKHRRITVCLLLVLLMALLSTSAFAVDESEVESAIAASGQDAVAGNLFIWFLCAVSFLKISQKIDSFMTSLGINVGRTGGSMMAEMLIAGRALGGAAKATGGAIGNIFNRGHSNTTNQATGQAFTGGGGGMIGVAKRAVGNAAAASATNTAVGLGSVVGGAMFGSSLNNGGKFATDVVGAVATGNISRVGSITGAKAAQALTSYLGYGVTAGNGTGAPSSKLAMNADSITSAAGESLTSPGTDIPVSRDMGGDDVITAEGGATAAAAAYADEVESSVQDQQAPIPQQPPTFRDVEIGGGRITGYETPADGGAERQFAMYNAGQYMTPQSGDYETVQTADGETWYKQYAQPTVEKTPHKEPGGQIKYDERIVDRMPQVPKRKDRI